MGVGRLQGGPFTDPRGVCIHEQVPAGVPAHFSWLKEKSPAREIVEMLHSPTPYKKGHITVGLGSGWAPWGLGSLGDPIPLLRVHFQVGSDHFSPISSC